MIRVKTYPKIYSVVKRDVDLFNAKSLFETCHYILFEVQNAYRFPFIASYVYMLYNLLLT